MSRCVAIVSRWYPNEQEPLSGIFVEHQVRALAGAATVHVVVPVSAGPARVLSSLRERGPLAGVTQVPVPSLPALGSAVRTVAFARVLDRLAPRPDVVHLHELLPDGLPLLLAARRRGMPLVVTEHSNFVDELMRSRRARMQLQRVLRGAGAVETSSAWVADQLATIEPAARPIDVGVPIDTDLFRPASSPSRDFALSVALRLGQAKGTDILLDAWHRTPDAPPLVLVGDDAGPWRRRAEELELGDRCRFVGSQPQAEIARLMAHAAVVVSASRSETFAGVVAEAIAAGTPVVSTDVGEPRRYVTAEVGVLVAAGSAESLSNGVRQVLAAGDRFDPDALHDHIASRYGYDAQRERLLALYRSLTA